MHDVIVRADQGRCWERPEHEVRWSGGTEDRGEVTEWGRKAQAGVSGKG